MTDDRNQMTDEARMRLVREAESWIGTPYHPHGQVKGAGCDCLTFLACAFHAAGLIPRIEIPHYSPDWHLHREEERYLNGLLQYCVEITPSDPRHLSSVIRPGDLVLWRFGRCFSHGAIVIAWPRILHAYLHRPCGYGDAERDQWLRFIGENVGDRGKERPRRFFTLKRWADDRCPMTDDGKDEPPPVIRHPSSAS